MRTRECSTIYAKSFRDDVRKALGSLRTEVISRAAVRRDRVASQRISG